MKRRRARQSIVANPVLIGGVTALVVVVAVFLAYNANQGLPFVPTTSLKVRVPNAAKLVVGNDVREGGFRIGVVDSIKPVRLPSGHTVAELTLKIDKSAGRIPEGTTASLRPKSVLGLKYVEITRGRSKKMLPDGATINVGKAANPVELEDVLGMFDQRTRQYARENLFTYGDAFAARGSSINRTLADLPRLLGSLTPVAQTLAAPDTQLSRFFSELEHAARVTLPVADSLSEGFTSAADTFEAISRDPQALEDTIAKSPGTLDVGTASLRVQRPFFRDLAAVSPDLRGAAHELRASLPPIDSALATGTPVLKRTPPFNDRLRGVFSALDQLVSDPTTNLALRGLTATVTTLNPRLRYLGPYVTVCNYWNSWWTNLSDHLTDTDSTGQEERIEAKTVGQQNNDLNSYGAARPANGDGYVPGASGTNAPVNLHNQPYGSAVDAQGNADCEIGQRGYLQRVAAGAPSDLNIAVDPHTPGDQGTTYTGRPRVPAGETFTSVPQTGAKP